MIFTNEKLTLLQILKKNYDKHKNKKTFLKEEQFTIIDFMHENIYDKIFYIFDFIDEDKYMFENYGTEYFYFSFIYNNIHILFQQTNSKHITNGTSNYLLLKYEDDNDDLENIKNIFKFVLRKN
jgi:hypothetical protein